MHVRAQFNILLSFVSPCVTSAKTTKKGYKGRLINVGVAFTNLRILTLCVRVLVCSQYFLVT